MTKRKTKPTTKRKIETASETDHRPRFLEWIMSKAQVKAHVCKKCKKLSVKQEKLLKDLADSDARHIAETSRTARLDKELAEAVSRVRRLEAKVKSQELLVEAYRRIHSDVLGAYD